MSHLRTQILDQVKALVTGLATTGARAFRSRVYPLETVNLPGLLVRLAGSEVMEVVTAPSPRTFSRTVRIQVIGLVQGLDEAALDAVLDQIALEVEKALAMPTASGPWKTLTLAGTEHDMDGDGEKLLGRVTLTYEAMYFARETTPDVLGG